MTISATAQGLRPGVCTSTSRPSAPFDGQVIYETDTNTLAVYDGSAWVSLNPVDRDRNVIINGAMQIAQRNTSVASITGTGYYTADRWYFVPSSMGTWTQSVENDAPTGSGFRKSLRMLCTTADASPSANDLVVLEQALEGQNVQKFKKGTSSAERFTLSFWVKSNVTGTYICRLRDFDNSRDVSASYTVSASGTWEKKTLTFPADTTGAFDNDNAASLYVQFWMGAGSTYTSGTLVTSWATTNVANIAVGQTNVAATTNNYWQVTGVQLEAGAVATPFEFEDYGTTLAKCQRYYFKTGGTAFSPFGTGTVRSSTSCSIFSWFPVEMRVPPTAISLTGTNPQTIGGTYSSASLDRSTTTSVIIAVTGSGYTTGQAVIFIGDGNGTTYLDFTGAEL